MSEPTWVEISKLFVDGCAFALAIVTAGMGLQRAHSDRKKALDQAKRDLRWRQTVEAQAAISRMHDDPMAENAMTLLDWNGLKFEVRPGKFERTNWDEMRKALRTTDLRFNAKEVFVRNSFDALFNSFQMIHQQINNGMYKLEDVSYPIAYFSRRIKHPRNWPSFETFMIKYNFRRARDLIEQAYVLSEFSGESDIDEEADNFQTDGENETC